MTYKQSESTKDLRGPENVTILRAPMDWRILRIDLRN